MNALAVAILLVAMSGVVQEKGIIGEFKEDGRPVVMKFVGELPTAEIRGKYRWLTVISWKYDGSKQNGMPDADELDRMKRLERTIESELVDRGLCLHAYSRTGNDLKELIYYIIDRETFMTTFNDALAKYPRYPIEINFYEDAEWKDFQLILERFNLTGS